MQINNGAIIDHAYGISTIDVEYKTAHFASSHLIVEGDRAALIDCGTNYSVPLLMLALQNKGIAPQQVQYLILTHVHLDHAGGAGQLMQKLPNATLLLHPRGARHMVDPRILYASASSVYGEVEMARSYGQLIPVAADRVRAVQDGEAVELNGRELSFLDTPGHAKHHVCVYDRKSRGVFSGDTFGLSYRAVHVNGEPFVFPSTTPPQFDPEAAHASIERIVALQPECVYLTHYGRVTDVPKLAADLHECLDAFVALAQRVQDAGHARHRLLRDELTHYLLQRLQTLGNKQPRELILAALELDIELNAQGLEFWLDSLPK
ncbi:MAG: MBL fold metallo-hydrolase [Chitinivorax sp.]